MDQVLLDLGGHSAIVSRIADPQGCWICFKQLHNKLLPWVPRETLKGLLQKAGSLLLHALGHLSCRDSAPAWTASLLGFAQGMTC